jgi:hypothetical protein
MSNNNKYDIIVLGGGIGGLYTAYKLLKYSQYKNILLVEKENILGGRVKTYIDEYMSVEAGAGRFHTKQKHIISLIRELQLENKMIPIDDNQEYFDSKNTIKHHKPIAIPNPNIDLINKLVKIAKGEPKEKLIRMTLLEYANIVLTEKEVQLLEDTFGYYTELVVMNAHDSINLMDYHLSSDHKYYVLKDGLFQIIDRLETILLESSRVKILRNNDVYSIKRIQEETGEHHFQVYCSKKIYNQRKTFRSFKTIYHGKNIISALPKQVLEKISFFKPIYPYLEKIYCGSLCRIYSKFPLDENGKSWFNDLNKFTTNNNLRIVIPVNKKEGIIMSCYTDNKFASFWKKLYEKGGEKEVNNELLRLLKQTTGINEIPEPIKTNIFYWNCGVGYWKVGADSKFISKKLIKPFHDSNLFICGEHFSEKNQEWIEGALETSNHVISTYFRE